MGLKVFKSDQATRDYENDFFREFASNLVKMFEEEHLDGILIGHPLVPENKYLQPDAVLITPGRLVLIDFKNHSGKLWLPEGGAFKNAPWRHDGVTLAGGTAVNPFAQLQRQRELMEELIGADTYGRYGIACMLCFQGDMRVMNKVPGKFQTWFSITNSYQYVNRIRDIIGVKNTHPVDIDAIAKHFKAKPYHDYYNVDLEKVEAAGDASARSEEAARRQYAAEQKVKELEKQIAETTAQAADLERLEDELAKAKRKATEAEAKAERATADFDAKRYQLELETQKSLQAAAEAAKAREEARRAREEAKRAEADATKAAEEARRAELDAAIEAILAKKQRRYIGAILCVVFLALLTLVFVFFSRRG